MSGVSVRSFIRLRSPVLVRSVVVIAVVLAGCSPSASASPFLLDCVLDDGSRLSMRIEPRLKEVVILDPVSGAIQSTLRDTDHHDGIPAGVLDDVRLSISSREVRWAETTYRPQFTTRTSVVDLETMLYSSSWDGPSPSEESPSPLTGRCLRKEVTHGSGNSQ